MTDTVAFRVMNEIGIIDQLGRNLFERVLPHALTVPQFIVLNHFVRLGGDRSPHELARALQVTKPTMTSTLQRLESKGFIKVVPDPKDGRGKRVSLTAAGRRARDRSIAALAPRLESLTNAIGATELETALPFLTTVRKYLDEHRE